jgi:hypothetical protein
VFANIWRIYFRDCFISVYLDVGSASQRSRDYPRAEHCTRDRNGPCDPSLGKPISLELHHLPSTPDTDRTNVAVIFRLSDESLSASFQSGLSSRVVTSPTPEQHPELILSQSEFICSTRVPSSVRFALCVRSQGFALQVTKCCPIYPPQSCLLLQTLSKISRAKSPSTVFGVVSAFSGSHPFFLVFAHRCPWRLVLTKCKNSVKDGRRLENLSWRLWHREMSTSTASSNHPPPTSPMEVMPSYETDLPVLVSPSPSPVLGATLSPLPRGRVPNIHPVAFLCLLTFIG